METHAPRRFAKFEVSSTVAEIGTLRLSVLGPP
jgi:hypothetical protein